MTQVTFSVEDLKVVLPAILYLGGLAYGLRSLKKQVNGIGAKLQNILLQNARIEVSLHLTPFVAPQEEVKSEPNAK